MSTLCVLRVAVAHLGEKPQSAWWDTSFLNATGFRYLGLIYPKTGPAAAVNSASEAACRIHDDRIGRGRVAHLFRLPVDIESHLRTEISGMELDHLLGICSSEAALQRLDLVANGAKPTGGIGPIQVGVVAETDSAKALARLAATYAAGFRACTAVFPYFA